MRFPQVVAAVLLLVSTSRALRPTDRSIFALESRGHGSGSTPPSPDHSSGLLGDVVKHAVSRPTGTLDDIVRQGSQRRPAPAVHGGQTSYAHGNVPVAHSSQLYSHSVHPGQSSQPNVIVHPTIHAPSQDHLHAPHQTLQGHPVHLSSSQSSAHSTHPGETQARPTRPARDRKVPSHFQATKGLGKLAGTVVSRPYVRDPAQTSDAAGSKAKTRAPYKPRQRPNKPRAPLPAKGQWWKRPGGRPSSQGGTSAQYEVNRAWREKQKILKAKGPQGHDEHPSGHQGGHPPHGGGPGSPGAGSHAVSRRQNGLGSDAWLPGQ